VPSALPVTEMLAALRARELPTVTVWNRLEGRPRTQSFERALRAEIRDPLWMLTKQWQMGEFRGADAGSPAFAKLQLDTTQLTKYQPGAAPVQAFDESVPLEMTVERRPVGLRSAGHAVALQMRLVMGRQWLKLTKAIGHRQAFIDAFPIAAPDPTDPEVCAHPQVWQTFAAVAGHAMDGGALYEYLTADAGHHAYDAIGGLTGPEQDAIDGAATSFLAWYARQIDQPPGSDDAWIPPRLEYSFAASAPGADGAEKVYRADAYAQVRLDWYSVDVDAAGGALGPAGPPATDVRASDVKTTIPVPVSFAGMPNTRWWSFEDARTNFGDIDASTTDLAKLMFLEFALVYANDWFVVPYTLPAGTIASVRGVAVTNVFGERFWIESADAGADADWQRWSMFTINVTGEPGAAADPSLLLLPTVPKVEQGPAVEDVWLIRDEVANMVWGVEMTVPMADGSAVAGRETARQTRAFFEAAAAGGPVTAPSPSAPVRYTVMTTVPEHWIPFLPVHVEASNREIQLQRAALPREIEGAPPPAPRVQPRTALLRQGLDAGQTYFIHEEEVPRAGARVYQTFERTRWTDGSVHVWLRVRRQTGRGEGSSGLAFDQLIDQPDAQDITVR
jgi:hypothetical protein